MSNRKILKFNKSISEYSHYFESNTRDFYILVEYMMTNSTYATIGKMHWITRERVRQIIVNIEKIILRLDIWNY